ncbi:hypothetical protein [Flavihumibacter sp.]|uniref:hypothetical protein n=1 Tax=Flavihumibacter sp. TaxID=1913981 RepID=UPI002FC6D9B9
MNKIELTTAALFEPLTEIEFSGINLDLHNEYSCNKITIDYNEEIIKFDFKAENAQQAYQRLTMVFETFQIVEMVSKKLDSKTVLTPDNFYRGRFEYEGQHHETTPWGVFFHIEFYEEFYLDILCKKAYLKIE